MTKQTESVAMPRSIELLQPIADKAAISLSALCAIHCLVLPIALTLLPSLSGLGLEDEAFHTWMLVFVLPISVFALTLGCRSHNSYGVLMFGIVGLVVLCAPLYLEHEMLGEQGEAICTLMGAALIALAHWRNYSLCQTAKACECPS